MQEEQVIRIVHRCLNENVKIGKIDKLGTDIGELKADVKELKADVKELKADVKELKADVKELKADVKELKADVRVLKVDVIILKSEQHRQGIMLEDMSTNIQRLLEVATDNGAQLTRLSTFYEYKEVTDNRLDAVEVGFRRHVKNRRVHRQVESSK